MAARIGTCLAPYDEPMEGDDPVWFGTPEAAKYIGETQRTLYRLIDAGDVPAYKLGLVMRIRRADLDDVLERSRVRPGELGHLYPSPPDEGGSS